MTHGLTRKRRQPIVTDNQINRKIDSVAGLVTRLRQDPKAFPRNPKNADGAEIAKTVLFFAGPESRNITGETLLSDSGLHLSMAGARR